MKEIYLLIGLEEKFVRERGQGTTFQKKKKNSCIVSGRKRKKRKTFGEMRNELQLE
jgi:hypothetical protein